MKKLKIIGLALAGVAQWIEHWPANQRVARSVPELQARSPVGSMEEANRWMLLSHIDVSLPLVPSLPLFLKNK